MRTLSEVVNAYKTAVQRRRRTAMASDMERKWYAARDDGWSPKMMSSNAHSGHLHMQTNEIRNLSFVHYRRTANGTSHRGQTFCDTRRRLEHIQTDQRPGHYRWLGPVSSPFA
jgi:hypothetical protein